MNKAGQLTIKEVAGALGLSVHTLRNWYRHHLLNGNGVTFAGWRVWHREDIPHLIDEIAAMIASRPFEKRPPEKIAMPLLLAWSKWETAHPVPSSLPDE